MILVKVIPGLQVDESKATSQFPLEIRYEKLIIYWYLTPHEDCLYVASSTLFFLVCRLFTLSNYFYCSFFCIILTSQSSIWECSRLEPQTLIWSTVTFVVDFGRFSNYFILLMPWEVTNISNSNLEMLSLNLDSTQFCKSRPTHTFKAGCLMNISALTDTKVNFWLFPP